MTITKNGIVLLSSEKSLKKAEERLQYHRQRDSHGYPLIKDDSAKNFKLDKYGVKMIKLKEVV
jgi:hypothetical protein